VLLLNCFELLLPESFYEPLDEFFCCCYWGWNATGARNIPAFGFIPPYLPLIGEFIEGWALNLDDLVEP